MEVKNQKSEIKNRDSPRQTLTYLRNLFEAHGIRPKKKLGPSFLIDLNPQVLDALTEVKRRTGCAPETDRPCRLKLVANLPYVVATPVIANFLLSDLDIERMVVTVQWEIAERLMARPGTKAYGALS